MHSILSRLELCGIIPVVVLDDAEDAPHVAAALERGGLPCAEVTFRTAAAPKAIELMDKLHPGMIIGAGTVLTVDQAQTALQAGAKFIVSPGLNRKVVEYCLERNVPVLPGIATPTELEAALECGLGTVKFFPAEASGGVEFLKAIAAPYPAMRFVPTGGIQQSNLLEYLSYSRVLACGGSWMVAPALIRGKQFDEIRRLTHEAVQQMLGFRFMHVGINGDSPEEAALAAGHLGELLRWPVREGASSIFVGSGFECTKKKFPGTHGHLALGTNFADRARAYLERRGYVFRSESATEKEGRLISIYLQQEISGFALHLLQL